MPIDIVKVLKTQDENYVRTMRNSNAKVGVLSRLRASEHLNFSNRKLTG